MGCYLLGISGKSGVGKTTFASILSRDKFIKNILKVVVVGFGHILKEEASEEYGFDFKLAFSQEGKKEIVSHPALPRENMSIREILQYHGDVRRSENKDYFVNYMGKIIDSLSKQFLLIVDDVRFLNEAKLIKSKGGYLVRIEPYSSWEGNSEHSSETELDDYKGWNMVLTPEYGYNHLALAASAIKTSMPFNRVGNDG